MYLPVETVIQGISQKIVIMLRFVNFSLIFWYKVVFPRTGKQTKDPPRQKALTRQKTLLDKRPSDKTPSDKRPSYELFFWNGGGSFVRADGQKALLSTKDKRPSGF